MVCHNCHNNVDGKIVRLHCLNMVLVHHGFKNPRKGIIYDKYSRYFPLITEDEITVHLHLQTHIHIFKCCIEINASNSHESNNKHSKSTLLFEGVDSVHFLCIQLVY